MIRTIWVSIHLFVSTLLLASLTVLGALVRVRNGGFYDWTARTWSRWVLRVSGARLRVEGLENLRPDEPQVIVSNHQSWYDIWAFSASLPKRYRFVAKKELSYIPIFGRAWKSAGHISIDRSNRAAAIRSLERAGELIDMDNSAVVIFPEGTRSPTGELLPFKKGAFMLALHTGVDIVPVGVSGTREILPKGKWRVRSGPITLRFGRPIRTADYGQERREELIETVRERVRALRVAPERTDPARRVS